MDKDGLKISLKMACDWLVDVAQIKTKTVDEKPIVAGCPCYNYADWTGAIRNEYRAAEQRWSFFGTVWHTGQAVKALTAADRILRDPKYAEAARLGAQFILRQQNRDKAQPDFGFIRAYEDVMAGFPEPVVNMSAILESLDGLVCLAESGQPQLWDNVTDALRWIDGKSYINGEGLFRGPYCPGAGKMIEEVLGRKWFRTKDDAPGRPLLDDGVFMKAYRHTGEKRFRTIFLETADRLVRDQNPPGNWIDYAPASATAARIHPRHAYWWSRPMLAAYQETGDRKYLDCVEASAAWYAKAQRHDGGLFRWTYLDFNTDSFGHATSGVACAVILWLELERVTGRSLYRENIERALAFCQMMQMADAQDPNLKGTILEKVLPPDGTDALPYHNRDLGSSFFVQAASLYLGGDT